MPRIAVLPLDLLCAALALTPGRLLAGAPEPPAALAAPRVQAADAPVPIANEVDFWAPVAVDDSVRRAPAAELGRGEAFLRVGALNQAARAFRRVVAAQPESPRAWERLRRTAIEARRTDILPEILVRLCDLYLATGSPDDRSLAEARLDELVAIDPQHPARERFDSALGRVAAGAIADGLQLGSRLRSLLGIFVLLGLCYLLSSNRQRVKLAVVGWGIALQVVFAVLILWTPPGRYAFEVASSFVYRILKFTDEGARFVFGKLFQGLAPSLTQGPVQVVDGTSGDFVNLGMIFAVHVLPTIIFFSSLMAVLYHLRVIQAVVRGVAWVMIRTMKTSGAESLCAAANIFLGQTEAPLVVKPYIAGMTRSELMAVMVGGFATISAGVLAVYAQFGIDPGHLLAASVMSAPASLAVAKILFPETDVSATQGGRVKDPERGSANVIDAAASGAGDGMRLALNVAAMLIAFLGLIAMLNWGLGWVGGFVNHPELSLKVIFGYLFYPLSWCLGVDIPDLMRFGNLVGTQLSVNEFVAYLDLTRLKAIMTPRSFTIATYALCGFANLGSVGIQIGGISGIAPDRRSDLARIGLKAMLGGAIASWITACIAGILI
jgi:concentrative nucleoside transporter, CNT family